MTENSVQQQTVTRIFTWRCTACRRTWENDGTAQPCPFDMKAPVALIKVVDETLGMEEQ